MKNCGNFSNNTNMRNKITITNSESTGGTTAVLNVKYGGDDIYITGEYRNPMVFPGANASNGSDTLSHKQKRDVFVAKMNNQG